MMTKEKMRYAENLVRSATAPDTIVAAAPAKAEPLFAEATRALSTTQRAQLASAAPLQEPRVIKAMTAPPSSALARATCAAAQLDEPGVLELLDAIGERAPFEEGDGRCLRLCHAVLRRRKYR